MHSSLGPLRGSPFLRRPSSAGAVVLVLLALSATLSGCATVKPGTGDISFRLLWDGTSDLDLHVDDPVGRHVGVASYLRFRDPEKSFEALRAQQEAEKRAGDAAPGILDIDCNADPERMCKRPIENVYWPEGTALRGAYRVSVQLFQQVGETGAVPFTLEVRRGRTVVQTFDGMVDRENPDSDVFTVEY